MKKGIIDRFEGPFAVIELDDGEMLDYLREKLHETITVGDVIFLHDNGTITYDPNETASRRQEIEDLANELFEDE